MSLYNVEQIADIVKCDIKGDYKKDSYISGISTLEESGCQDITFLGNKKYIDELQITKSGYVLINKELFKNEYIGLKKVFFIVDNAYLAYAKLLSLFEKKDNRKGISEFANISGKALIKENIFIDDFVKIGDDSIIGDSTKILSGVKIENNVKIGDNCIIYENVVIRSETVIGNNVIIHPGTVIGGDGFGFVPLDGSVLKIPHIGNVKIGNNVEIGCNVTIDRGVSGSTSIGDFTKIDNLVHIAHNVKIGKYCFIVAQVGISGSVKIGDGVSLAGQVGVTGHLEIGNNVIVGARAVVMNNIKSDMFVSGYPAINHKDEMRIKACLKKLPEMVKFFNKAKKNEN
ncbi:MAG: UDP-3-O-(3-hydroxymyristoyl)glucosamine N-acyltransferase [Candidatus Muirbacterium halophilum]|nr:UDP-3-O-(3-hydroxymyristoyl)glucosamine N-acyltransferase [Candidatus Muirbacterium halophilum]MCK9474772.1 UDP-3-O-(3-hydroxymyristoyl)glucosamine N-acyltransferase [Candidatus Muirbacterium halophilum]